MPEKSAHAAPRVSRLAARGSILAPFACLLLMCVSQQLLRGYDPSPTTQAVYLVFSSTSSAILLAGFGLGLAALVGGRRNRCWPTMQLALLGLFVCGSAMLFCALVIASVWAAK